MAIAQQSKALQSLDQLNIPKVAHIAIVSTEWNDTIIAELTKGASTIFQQFPQIQISHYTVPGCVELSYALKKITTTQTLDAAIDRKSVV
jgi:6,7-dimethyl-8-ribityllumazine synthase